MTSDNLERGEVRIRDLSHLDRVSLTGEPVRLFLIQGRCTHESPEELAEENPWYITFGLVEDYIELPMTFSREELFQALTPFFEEFLAHNAEETCGAQPKES